MNKQTVTKWGKRAAFFAVFGVTGTVCLGVYHLVKTNKRLDKIMLYIKPSDFYPGRKDV